MGLTGAAASGRRLASLAGAAFRVIFAGMVLQLWRRGGLHACIAHATLRAPLFTQAKDKTANPMRDIKIEKVVLNISTGESGDKLTLAARVLEQLTGQKPVTSKGM